MPYTIELKTRVLAGHRIEICSPELPSGLSPPAEDCCTGVVDERNLDLYWLS